MAQRSPVIFWLLLAATLAVDAVVMSWLVSESEVGQLYPAIMFFGLITGELSVVCIWSTVSDARTFWIRLAPVPAVAMAALATALGFAAHAELGQAFVNQFAYFGFHVALLTIAVWILQRTKFWRRRTGLSRPWQFSVANMLVATTVVAILAPFLRHSELTVGDELWLNIAIAGSSVALAVASVMIWSLSCFWLLKLAGVLGLSILLASAVPLVVTQPDPAAGFLTFTVGAIYLLQGIVLSIWLGSGYIIPQPSASASVETPPHIEPARTE